MFTVEDGTGLDDANAFISVAYADSYFSDRGITDWTGTSTVKEQAIVRATDYIEQVWGPQFRGLREFPETPQALSWPRIFVRNREGFLIDDVPVQVQKACAEYALRALTGTLLPDPTASDFATKVHERVGPIETETEYAAGTVGDEDPSYPPADKLLEELTFPKGSFRA